MIPGAEMANRQNSLAVPIYSGQTVMRAKEKRMFRTRQGKLGVWRLFLAQVISSAQLSWEERDCMFRYVATAKHIYIQLKSDGGHILSFAYLLITSELTSNCEIKED